MPINIFTTIDDPLGTEGINAAGINGSGQIVGAYQVSGLIHGFVFSGGSFTTVDDPSGTLGNEAFGINASGQLVGEYKDASGSHGYFLSGNAIGTHGFLLSGGTYFTLDDPLATNGTEAFGINDAGQIVGRYFDASGPHGFLMVAAPNPPPPAGTTADMILRHDADGLYEIYDI